MSTVENVISALLVRKLPQRPWLGGLCLAATDVATVLGVMSLSLFVFSRWTHQSLLLADVLTPAAAVLLLFCALGLYTSVGLSPVQEFERILAGTAVGYGVAAAALTVVGSSRTMLFMPLACSCLATILFIPVCREILRRGCYDRSWWGTPTVIVGSGRSARVVLDAVKRQPSLNMKVVGIFAQNHPDWTDFDKKRIHVGTLHSLFAFVETYRVDHAVIAHSKTDGEETDRLIKRCARGFKTLLVIPEVTGIPSVWVEPRDLGGVLGLQVRQNLLHRNPRALKRLFDVVFTSLLLIALSPLFLIIYALIRLTSPGSAFYGQARMGRGSTFSAWKFRTMLANADEVLPQYLARDSALREEWERDRKLKIDPRITSIGRFLRKTSLDELPQLWNVLRGEMSLVGPRPIPVSEIVGYRETLEEAFEAYQTVRPGITGMWQVSGRNNTTYPERLQFDEYYVRNWSIWLDLYILVRTCKTVLLREGAC